MAPRTKVMMTSYFRVVTYNVRPIDTAQLRGLDSKLLQATITI